MAKKRVPILLFLIVLFPAVIAAFVVGLWAFMSATATPLHPNAQDVPSVTTTTPARKWAAAVDRGRQIMRASVTEDNLPGLSVAIGVGGEIVWAEGFGFANLEDRVKVAPETPFKIGMASKVLTSAAVGLLLEQGKLKLDDEIQTYVPAFPKKQAPVTLRQLMGHMSGVKTDDGDEGPLSEHCEQTLEGLRLFADKPLWFDPGTQYRYSNFGWILVSAAVEAAGGQPFLRFMRDQIFEPLGMENTRADSPTDPNRAAFYFPRFAADPRYGQDGVRQVDYSCFAGSGDYMSTPTDLVRYGMAINNGKLLQPATVQLLQTSQRLPSGEETGYGLGWNLETVELAGAQTQTVGHDGEVMGGPVASLLTFPKHGIVVAVTSNIAYANTFELATSIAQAFATQR